MTKTSYVPRPGSDGARALEILVARGVPMLGADQTRDLVAYLKKLDQLALTAEERATA